MCAQTCKLLARLLIVSLPLTVLATQCNLVQADVKRPLLLHNHDAFRHHRSLKLAFDFSFSRMDSCFKMCLSGQWRCHYTEYSDQFHTGVVNFKKRMENKTGTYTHELQSSFQHHDPCRGHSSGQPPTMPGDPAFPCLHLLMNKSRIKNPAADTLL